MFEIGDYIVYGNTGVCRVENIGSINALSGSKDRLYYTLCPCYVRESTIFTPVDNQKVEMRPVLTKEEAYELIDEIREIGCLGIADEKKREYEYKQSAKTCDCREFVKMIKTIYLRKETRLAEGKKITASDERYFQIAEDGLYGELAIALGMDRGSVKEFVTERVDETVAALQAE